MGRTRARRRARPVSPPQFGLRFTDIFLDNERYLPIDSTAELISKDVGFHEENAFPIILFPDISSRAGGRILQLPAGIELAKTSLRMFLKEGLDPFRSFFDLPIPASSAFLIQTEKPNWTVRTDRLFVAQ